MIPLRHSPSPRVLLPHHRSRVRLGKMETVANSNLFPLHSAVASTGLPSGEEALGILTTKNLAFSQFDFVLLPRPRTPGHLDTSRKVEASARSGCLAD